MGLTVQLVEGVGIAVLALGIVAGLALAAIRGVRGTPLLVVYRDTRRLLGRVLLLGIEVLVAADIIHTVATEVTLTGVAELAGIVAIRTFLSWSIELETEGRWPWRARGEHSAQTPGGDSALARPEPSRSPHG